jgi:hypothetical protein
MQSMFCAYVRKTCSFYWFEEGSNCYCPNILGNAIAEKPDGIPAADEGSAKAAGVVLS